MFRIDLNKIALTLWFFFGALAVCLFLAADAWLVQSISTITDFGVWARTTLTACGLAALSGFLVDALRFLGSVCWPRNLPHQVKTKKILNQHL